MNLWVFKKLLVIITKSLVTILGITESNQSTLKLTKEKIESHENYASFIIKMWNRFE